MKKILVLVLTLLLSLIISIPVFADTDVESAGNIFMFENAISREFESRGDVYAFGNSINLNGSAEGDILAFGNEININSKEVGGSIRSAGATLKIFSNSVRNITAAGGTVTVIEGTTAKGVYIAGGTIDFLGTAEDLYIAGDVVTINGTITGDVKVECNQLIIGQNAKIDGKINVKSAKEPEILGDIDTSKLKFEQINSSNEKGIKSVVSIGSIILKIISSIFLALLLVLICRGNLEKTTVNLMMKPWLPFVIGFCTLVVLPIAAILTFITIVGIPIGVISLIIYGVIIYLSPIVTSIVIGKVFMKNINLYLSSIALVVVLRLLLLVPYLGGILRFICMLLALGIFILEIIDRIKKNNGNALKEY
jgi:hypothetical protein